MTIIIIQTTLDTTIAHYKHNIHNRQATTAPAGRRPRGRGVRRSEAAPKSGKLDHVMYTRLASDSAPTWSSRRYVAACQSFLIRKTIRNAIRIEPNSIRNEPNRKWAQLEMSHV